MKKGIGVSKLDWRIKPEVAIRNLALALVLVFFVSEAGSQEKTPKQYPPAGKSLNMFRLEVNDHPKEFAWMFDVCAFDYGLLKFANKLGAYGKVDISSHEKVAEFFHPFFLHCNRKIISRLDIDRIEETSFVEFENTMLEIAHQCGYYRDQEYVRLLFSLYVLGEENVKSHRNFSCGEFHQSGCHFLNIDSVYRYGALQFLQSGIYDKTDFEPPTEIEPRLGLSEDEYDRLGIPKEQRNYCDGVGGWKDRN